MSFRKLLFTSSILAASALFAAEQPDATPAVISASAYLQVKDFKNAIFALETGARTGDITAIGHLSSVLRSAPPPFRDDMRACELAKVAAEKENSLGQMTMAECLLSGTTSDGADRYAKARTYAKLAALGGHAQAGFLSFVAFSADPAYKYVGADGRPDPKKYEALSKMPVDKRADQVDALNGLGESARAGYAPALYTLIAVLLETSAPGNNDRAIALAEKLRTPVPEQLRALIGAASFAKRAGGTNAAASAFTTAYPQALGLAAALISKTEKCEPSQVRLESSSAGPVTSAAFLPTDSSLVRDVYLVSGQWSESWTFAGCGNKVELAIGFTADGWGGARHAIRLSSPK